MAIARQSFIQNNSHNLNNNNNNNFENNNNTNYSNHSFEESDNLISLNNNNNQTINNNNLDYLNNNSNNNNNQEDKYDNSKSKYLSQQPEYYNSSNSFTFPSIQSQYYRVKNYIRNLFKFNQSIPIDRSSIQLGSYSYSAASTSPSTFNSNQNNSIQFLSRSNSTTSIYSSISSNNNNNNSTNNNNLKMVFNSTKTIGNQIKKRKHIVKEFGIRCCRHVLVMCAILAIIIPISLYITNNSPRKYDGANIEFEGEDYDPRHLQIYDTNLVANPNIFLDPHSHSTYSDGKLSVENLILWHIKNGFNAMIVTDHNTVSGGLAAEKLAKEKYQEKIVVIPGIEWTNCRVHLGLIGIREDVPLIKRPTNTQIKEIIDKVHSLGGLVVLNHYPWSTWAGLDQPSMEEWKEMGIDFLEVVNESTMDYQGLQFALKNGIRYTTGSDYHFDQRGMCWTVLDSPNITQPYNKNDTINAKYLTSEIVMDALRTLNTTFIFDPVGSGISIKENNEFSSTYNFMAPWVYLGDFFHSYYVLQKGMYSFVDGPCTDQHVVVYGKQLISLIGWIIFFFIAIELIYQACKVLYRRFFKIHTIDPITPSPMDKEGYDDFITTTGDGFKGKHNSSTISIDRMDSTESGSSPTLSSVDHSFTNDSVLDFNDDNFDRDDSTSTPAP
ncbi:hypothetical protein DFA_05824 [Cavenderia fasciculata]|uniref:Polymerase/histidinol phosphatase N-terminal domain-containing protein n=1 Tax=Cavenderia fasciculata TaxID=261658 RepID=F4PMU6_CACFS|nr:uncharacterized protein DFA_05824 [Cavenderia fasciculata]EGG23690.1 hypothetical protein DFA_05824 [Cavenderia fasciculata]|eukprot:XP_004361541.1 hypothetical protein DFA_05824 [Cavenderia fasciculata]